MEKKRQHIQLVIFAYIEYVIASGSFVMKFVNLLVISRAVWDRDPN